jgi:pyruvate kinase
LQMTDGGAHRRRDQRKLTISETICESIAHAAQDMDLRAIAVYTETGNTAKLISKYRPSTDIYSLTYVPAVCNRANLLWGVHPILCKHTPSVEDMVEGAENELTKRKIVVAGDVIGIVAGTQTTSGSTNFMRLHVIGSQNVNVARKAAGRIVSEKRKQVMQKKTRDLLKRSVAPVKKLAKKR